MEQALFIVWRESIEALLVVGILHTWLRRQAGHRGALRHLWLGVALGLGLAALLGAAMLATGQWLEASADEWFQAGMSAVASALVLQMAAWMARHGRGLRQQLEQEAGAALADGRSLGLAVLAMLAIAREGSETAIFLYGVGAQPGTRLAPFVTGSVLGLALGVLCFVLLQQAGKAAGWRRFFKGSQLLLVLLGGAMLMSALDRAAGQLLALDLPSSAYGLLGDALWDSSALLDDGSRAGALVAAFTGYRAMPTLPAVALLGAYWLLAWKLLRPAPAPHQPPA